MSIEIAPKQYQKIMSYYDAELYCVLLTIDGKNDWRMPSLDELKNIERKDVNYRYIDDEHPYAWSSMHVDSDNVITMSFYNKKPPYIKGQLNKSVDFVNFVIPVRDL